jgi:hypothetical protein
MTNDIELRILSCPIVCFCYIVEKRRRQKINECIQALGSMLPTTYDMYALQTHVLYLVLMLYENISRGFFLHAFIAVTRFQLKTRFISIKLQRHTCMQ